MTATPTVYQLLRRLSESTGDLITLKPYDRLDAVQITDTRQTVFVTTHRFVDTGTKVTLTKQGTRMIDYKLVDGRGWVKSDRTLWDDDFKPLVVDQRWEGKSVQEAREKLIWESICGRPDTRSRDIDQIGSEVARAWNATQPDSYEEE